MSEWTYIWAAYALTWVTLTAYAIYLGKRVRRAARIWTSTAATRPGGGR